MNQNPYEPPRLTQPESEPEGLKKPGIALKDLMSMLLMLLALIPLAFIAAMVLIWVFNFFGMDWKDPR